EPARGRKPVLRDESAAVVVKQQYPPERLPGKEPIPLWRTRPGGRQSRTADRLKRSLVRAISAGLRIVAARIYVAISVVSTH
ncbi:MAG: hypothetical protein JXA30_09350, partial [Deltaproteobacteria bacterium]|nr:hypothetical protein [Deltaproteobacteria bacterium]